MGAIDEELAWRLLLCARRQRQQALPGACRFHLRLAEDGAPQPADSVDALLTLAPEGWSARAAVTPPAAMLLDLYHPLLCFQGPHFVIGHLGQSLDGRIATLTGVSQHLNDPANILHLHRLRALSDAILVGANTVFHDDPQLTTRLAPGDNPVRIVLDPRRRLNGRFRLFTDQAAPTVIVCQADYAGLPPAPPGAEVIALPVGADGRLPLPALVEQLAARRLPVLFVEGGGVTVSAFLQAGLLDQLHIAIAPLIIGSGCPGIQLPPVTSLDGALRPRVKVLSMGADVLFVCSCKV